MSAITSEPVRQRLFFALWPTSEVLERLKQIREKLNLAEGKLVPPENLHITLLFLGDVPEEQIPVLENMARGIPFEPCDLTLDRLEHWVRPAVLCLVASQTPPALENAVAQMKRKVRQLGIKTEKRPFRPHLTLARKVRKRVVSKTIEPVHWPVNEMVLVASELNREGSRYRILGRWP